MSYQVNFHKDSGKEIISIYLNNKPLFFSLIALLDSLTTCNNREQIMAVIKKQTEDYIEETIIDKQVAFRMEKNVYVFFEIRGKMIRIAKIAVINK